MKTKLKKDLMATLKDKTMDVKTKKYKKEMIQLLISDLETTVYNYQKALNKALKNVDNKKAMSKVKHIQFHDVDGEKVVVLTKEQELDVVKSYVNAQRDVIKNAEKLNRDDLIKEANLKIELASEYLPKLLTEEEILAIMIENKATKSDNVGSIVGQVMKEHKAEVDGVVVRKVAEKHFKA